MNNVKSLCHSVWDCKYHIVWMPKYRRKVLFGRIREYLGEVIRELAQQKESQVLEGHLNPGARLDLLVFESPRLDSA